MTKKETHLVNLLRQLMLVTGYQNIYAVDNDTLCAVETAITEDLERKGLPPILQCGKHGLFFKGCELVLIEN